MQFLHEGKVDDVTLCPIVETDRLARLGTASDKTLQQILVLVLFFFLLALQPPLGVVFYSPLAGFSLLAYEVS